MPAQVSTAMCSSHLLALGLAYVLRLVDQSVKAHYLVRSPCTWQSPLRALALEQRAIAVIGVPLQLA